jgi:hypothetical protein
VLGVRRRAVGERAALNCCRGSKFWHRTAIAPVMKAVAKLVPASVSDHHPGWADHILARWPQLPLPHGTPQVQLNHRPNIDAIADNSDHSKCRMIMLLSNVRRLPPLSFP